MSSPGPPPLPLAVAVIVQRADRSVLVVRRAEHLALGGYWTPVTGRVERGESLADAAHRELREEVGLTADLGAELARGPTSSGLFELVYFIARAHRDDAPLLLEPREIAEARWIDADDLARLSPLLATTRAILAQVLAPRPRRF